MLAVSSLLTRTPRFEMDRGLLAIHTLSICLAKRAFGRVHFVTDSDGYQIARAMRWPFTSITRALDLVPDGYLHAWAVGKAYAILNAGKPCVHVDGDVLLWKPLPDSLLRSELIAQSPDKPGHYQSRDMDKGMAVLGFHPGFTAYNAGIIGGADLFALRQFAQDMIGHVGRFAAMGHPVNGTVESMLAEQYHLGILAEQFGYEVGTLFPSIPTRAEAIAAGYTHLVGKSKRDPEFTDRAEYHLKIQFPEAHGAFLRGWNRLSETRHAAAISAQ